MTQNENLADIAGLQVALKAYQKYLTTSNSQNEKLKLPGLKFTRNQMYFLSVAQVISAQLFNNIFLENKRLKIKRFDLFSGVLCQYLTNGIHLPVGNGRTYSTSGKVNQSLLYLLCEKKNILFN